MEQLQFAWGWINYFSRLVCLQQWAIILACKGDNGNYCSTAQLEPYCSTRAHCITLELYEDFNEIFKHVWIKQLTQTQWNSSINEMLFSLVWAWLRQKYDASPSLTWLCVVWPHDFYIIIEHVMPLSNCRLTKSKLVLTFSFCNDRKKRKMVVCFRMPKYELLAALLWNGLFSLIRTFIYMFFPANHNYQEMLFISDFQDEIHFLLEFCSCCVFCSVFTDLYYILWKSCFMRKLLSQAWCAVILLGDKIYRWQYFFGYHILDI